MCWPEYSYSNTLLRIILCTAWASNLRQLDFHAWSLWIEMAWIAVTTELFRLESECLRLIYIFTFDVFEFGEFGWIICQDSDLATLEVAAEEEIESWSAPKTPSSRVDGPTSDLYHASCLRPWRSQMIAFAQSWARISDASSFRTSILNSNKVDRRWINVSPGREKGE